MAQAVQLTEAEAEAKIATLGQQLIAARGELERLTDALGDEENDAALGAPGAAERAEQLRAQVGVQRREIDRIGDQHGKATGGLARMQARRAEVEAIERQHRVVDRDAKIMALSHLVDRLAHDLAGTINELDRERGALAADLGTVDAHRMLAVGSLRDQLIACFRTVFVRTSPLAADERFTAGGNGLPLNWFLMSMEGKAPNERQPFATVMQRTQDALVNIFGSEAAAEEARARRDQGRHHLHVLRAPPLEAVRQLWVIVVGRLRGAAARREQSADPQKAA